MKALSPDEIVRKKTIGQRPSPETSGIWESEKEEEDPAEETRMDHNVRRVCVHVCIHTHTLVRPLV